MKTLTREEFTELAKNVKPRLRRELRFVPEEISNWQDRDFLAVMNRSNTEGVLVLDGHAVSFRLQARKPGASGRTEAIICDFCATWQRGSNSASITFTREKSTQTFLCCGDLLCSLHVRNKTQASKISRTQLRENNTVEERVARLRARLSELVLV